MTDLLFTHSPIATGILSENGIWKQVNSALCALTGHTEQALLHLPYRELFVDEAPALPALHSAPSPFEVRWRHPALEARWVQLHFAPLPEQDRAWIVQAVDLTAQKTIEQSLRIYEQRYTLGFDKSLSGVGVITPEGQFLEANPTFCQMLGYSEEALLGLNLLALTDPADVASVQSILHSFGNGEQAFHQFENRYRRQDGDCLWGLASIFSVYDLQGQLKLLVLQCIDITRHKHLEQHLRQEKENLSVAFDNAAVGMALVSTEGRYLKVNPRMCEITGYSEAELTQRTVFDIAYPDDRDQNTVLLEALGSGKSRYVEAEKRYLHKNGQVIWTHLFAAYAYDISNQTPYYFSQVQDITLRKQAEDALKASEENFRLAFENAAMGIALFSLHGDFLKANREMCRILGYTEAELQQLTVMAITYPDDRERDKQMYQALIEARQSTCEYEKRFIHKNGTVIWVALAGSCLFDETGQPVNFVSQIYDITEKKAVTQALKYSEEKFRSAFQYAPIGMALVSPEGRWLRVNQAVCDITGYSEQALLGTDFQSITHPDDLPDQGLHTRMLKRELQNFQREKRYIHKQGHIVWVQLNVSGIFDETGELTHQIAQIQDITARLESEQILRKAKEDAEAAARAKADFLATMSHEIRTPLNAVLGMSCLLEETPLNDEQQDLVQTIQNGGRNLLGVINDILDFSKIESGKMDMDWQPTDIRACMDDTLCLFRQKAQEKGVTLSDNVTEAVPRLIRCDSMRLRQILTNLVGNALKFTEHGFISITVDCQPHPPETPNGPGDFLAPSDLMLIVSVRDTGCGIPSDKLASIFESFTQVDSSTTRRFGGTGLGLAISSRLAQLLGGQLEVESALGQGSLFRLKLQTQSLEQKPATRPLSLAPNPSSRLADDYPLKILVAEDNLINQKLICKILTQFGYEPALANNGAQALEALAEHPFDLIFMDVQMPVMDGLEASRLIRERYANPPGLIALTAFGLPEDRERFLAEGMDDYLSKPIFPNQVAELLGRWHNKLYPKPGVTQADYLDVDSLLQRVSRDMEILQEMRGLFHEDGHRLIQELHQAYQEGDISGVRRIAHELKGASLTLSATILHQRLGKIETLARDHKLTDMEPILNQLPFIFKQTQQALDALLSSELAQPLEAPLGTQCTGE